VIESHRLKALRAKEGIVLLKTTGIYSLPEKSWKIDGNHVEQPTSELPHPH